MTRVAVYLESADPETMSYRAVSGRSQAMGRTAGEALNALASQLPQDDTDTLVIVRNMSPDRFFSAEQRRRLEELMALRREAAAGHSLLTPQEEAELGQLVEAEVQAATERAKALFHDLAQMNRHYAGVAERAGHRCEYCHAPEAIFNLPFEVEHIVPTSRDGLDDASNQALACRACNLYKSDLQSGVDETTGVIARLFDPRRDRWDDHFRMESEDGTILGLTPTGRVTIMCLRMNREVQREARRSWMKLKLYP